MCTKCLKEGAFIPKWEKNKKNRVVPPPPSSEAKANDDNINSDETSKIDIKVESSGSKDTKSSNDDHN